MKKLACCFMLVCLCALLCLPARALTYVDDFTDSANNNIKSYTNLAHLEKNTVFWGGLPDSTAFGFASPATFSGHAIYRVQNARQVKVGFYTRAGTFVHWLPPDNSADTVEGKWIVGLSEADVSVLLNTQLPQAGFSPSIGSIYAAMNGRSWKAFTNKAYLELQQTPEQPGDLIGYGVNVYVSASGQSWSRISLSYTSRQNGRLVYEEMTGGVPANTQLVKVELNDYRSIPLTTGGSLTNLASDNCLASVTFAGDNMTLGIPEPVLTEPLFPEASVELESPDESENSAKSTSSKAASSKTASSRSSSTRTAASYQAAGGAQSSSKYEGSKFEGMIESSAKNAKAQSASSSRSSSSSMSESVSTVSPAQPEDSIVAVNAAEDAIYQIESKSDDNKSFTVFITLYIIIVTGALTFIVVSSAAKKK